jgi:hypothetical protein
MDKIAAVGRFLIGTAFGGGAAAESRASIVQETPVHSGDEEASSDDKSDEESPKFLFKKSAVALPAAADAQNGRDQYMRSVLNWSTAAFIGRLALNQKQADFSSKSSTLQHISIGSYNVPDIIEMVQNAADSAGFTVYPHKGPRVLRNRCTIKFRCDHGRKRYGIDDVRDKRVLQKDLHSIVKDTCRKKRTVRLHDGYQPAEKNQSRLKSNECNFQFSIIAYQQRVAFDQTQRADWHLTSHGSSIHNFAHSSHTWRGTKISINSAAKNMFSIIVA